MVSRCGGMEKACVFVERDEVVVMFEGVSGEQMAISHGWVEVRNGDVVSA
jgi:hypothetical protein